MTKEFTRTYVLDCGKNSFTLFEDLKATKNSKTRVLTREEVLHIYKILEPGSRLVFEYSHGGCPRKGLSLSQPFEAHELLDWYDNLKAAGITLKLFPQKSTPRATHYAYHVCGFFNDIDFDDVKSDDRDPIMIAKFLEDHPTTSMMNPPASFENKDNIIEAWEMKSTSNEILNYARRFKSETLEEHESGYVLPASEYRVPNDGVINFILNNIENIFEELDDVSRNVFGIHKDRKGKIQVSTNKSWKIKICQMYSIIVQLIDHEGNFRFRASTEDLVGWNFTKRYLLCMTPFHLRGGVARSNLFHHGMKNWIAEMAKSEGVSLKKKGKTGKMSAFVSRGSFTPEQNLAFNKYRKQYCDSIRKLFQVSKSIMQNSEKYAEHRSSFILI